MAMTEAELRLAVDELLARHAGGPPAPAPDPMAVPRTTVYGTSGSGGAPPTDPESLGEWSGRTFPNSGAGGAPPEDVPTLQPSYSGEGGPPNIVDPRVANQPLYKSDAEIIAERARAAAAINAQPPMSAADAWKTMPPGQAPVAQPGAPMAPGATPVPTPEQILASASAQRGMAMGGPGGGMPAFRLPDARDEETIEDELSRRYLSREITRAQYTQAMTKLKGFVDPTVADKMSPNELGVAAFRSEQAAERAGMAGVTAGMDAESVAALYKGKLLNQAVSEREQIHADHERRRRIYRADLDGQMARYQEGVKQLGEMEVDPSRMFNGKNAWRGVLGAIAVGLGAAASILSDGKTPNFAMQMIQQGIQNDIDAQKANINTKSNALWHEKGLVGFYYKRLGDLDMAESAAMASAYQMTQLKVEAMTVGLEAPVLQARKQALIAQLEQKQRAAIGKLYGGMKQQAMQQAAAAAAAQVNAQRQALQMKIANMGGQRLDKHSMEKLVRYGDKTYLLRFSGGVGERRAIRDMAATSAQYQDLMGEVEMLVESGAYLSVQGQARVRGLAGRAKYTLMRLQTGANTTAMEFTAGDEWLPTVDLLSTTGITHATIGTMLPRIKTSREIVDRQFKAGLHTLGAVPVDLSDATGMDKDGPMQWLIPEQPSQ